MSTYPISLTIRWNWMEKDRFYEYLFHTEAEKQAFLNGANAGAHWHGYEILDQEVLDRDFPDTEPDECFPGTEPIRPELGE